MQNLYVTHVHFGVAYDQEVMHNLVLRIMLWVSLTIWKASNLTQIDGKTKETHTQHQEVLRCAHGKFSILQESVIKSKFYIEMATKKISAVSIAQINIYEYAMYLGAFNLCVVKCWLTVLHTNTCDIIPIFMQSLEFITATS